jgi:cell wall-associated NlpC family hydrolase
MDKKKIIEKAREYVGVRFRHFGRSKSGIDCTNLMHISLIAGSEQPDKVPPLPPYSKRPMPRELLKEIKQYMYPIEKEEAREGDIVLMRYGGRALHLALFTGNTLIHAALINRKVIEHPIDPSVKPHIYKYYSFKDI